MNFKEEVINILLKETNLKKEEIDKIISIPPDQKLGDYAFPCFKLGKNPKEEAEKLKEKISLPNFLEKINVAGPYLNFYIKKPIMAEETLVEIYQKRRNYGNWNYRRNQISQVNKINRFFG